MNDCAPFRSASAAIKSPSRSASSLAASTVAVGDKLPESKFKYFDGEGNMKEIGTEEMCKGKKVVLFAVPGAFTPTCSMKHLPGFVEKAEEIKSKGVDTIACISVNGECDANNGCDRLYTR